MARNKKILTVFLLFFLLFVSFGPAAASDREIRDRSLPLLNRARQLFHEKNFRGAMKYAQQYKEAVPGDHQGWQVFGLSLYSLGNYDRAKKELEQAVKIHRDDFVSRTYLGSIELKKGRNEEAFVLLREASRQAPDYAQGHIFLGQAYLAEKNLIKARGEMRRAMACCPIPENDVYIQIANAYLAAKLPNDATYVYNKFLHDDPENAEINFHMGRVFESTGSKRAEFYYKKAVEFGPESARFKETLAQWYEKNGKAQESKTLYEEAAKTGNARPQTLFKVGMNHYGEGKIKEALPYLEQSLKGEPKNTTARLALSSAYLRSGNYDKSIAHNNQILKYDADNEVAYYNNACAYAMLGKKPQALAALKKAVQLEPENRKYAVQEKMFDSLKKDETFRTLTGEKKK